MPAQFFVERGGGYVHHEWNAYQLSVGQFQLLHHAYRLPNSPCPHPCTPL